MRLRPMPSFLLGLTLTLVASYTQAYGGGSEPGRVGNDGRPCNLRALPPPVRLQPPAPPKRGAPSNPHPKGLYQLRHTLTMIVGVHLVHVPHTDWYLLMERPSGNHPDDSCDIAGLYQYRTGEWIHIRSPDALFCAGHTLLPDGRVVIMGGHKHPEMHGWKPGLDSLRVLDLKKRELVLETKMRWNRWYPTGTLMPDGRILIMGGTKDPAAKREIHYNKYYEIWDPKQPKGTDELPLEETYLQATKTNYYPFNWVLPNGHMFNFCGRVGWIMDPYRNRYIKPIPKRQGYANTQYPFTGTGVMLALKPDKWDKEVEFVLFGGAPENAALNVTLGASKEAHRLKVLLPQNANGTYGMADKWEVELMGENNVGINRVMGDATLLPNGHVILLNGAQRGIAGDNVNAGQNKANNPTFMAQLYEPDKPAGRRWTNLESSRIPRLYHSTAALTIEGTILITGCDRCRGTLINSTVPFDPSPTGQNEFRVEIFYPPVWFLSSLKPRIGRHQQVITYNQPFTVEFGSERRRNRNQRVTGAVLVAPSSTTHSFNMNQRVIFLQNLGIDASTRTARFQSPPNANIAQPQYYMLFLLNGDVYSRGSWIQLITTKEAAAKRAFIRQTRQRNNRQLLEGVEDDDLSLDLPDEGMELGADWAGAGDWNWASHVADAEQGPVV